jgi:hypothetical protein
MARYIIVALAIFVVIAILAIWVISGGPRALAGSISEKIASAVPDENDVGFQLPWQPAQIFPTLDITEMMLLEGDTSAHQSPGEQLVALEAEYDRLSEESRRMRDFGAPSPHAGQVSIANTSNVRSSNPREEHIQIMANYGNSGPIDVAGWVLESALSGVRVVIPPAASPFIANSANILGPVSLDPGAAAIIATAPSPIGVSFRENLCTGYLGQFQSFEPPLSENCPSPSSVLPMGASNLQTYGGECFDAINNLSQCRFPQNLPNNISQACRSFLTETLSYNGCVSKNRFRSAFQGDTWRMYLGASGELWRNSHDAIRLLDTSGRTVSVFVY